jgi:hypothetical protein
VEGVEGMTIRTRAHFGFGGVSVPKACRFSQQACKSSRSRR